MKVVDFCEAKCSTWFAMQNASGSNHSSFRVCLAGDVIVSVVEIDSDVSGLVEVERPERDSTQLFVFTSIEPFYVAHNCLASDNWFALEHAADVTKQRCCFAVETDGTGCRRRGEPLAQVIETLRE